MDKVVLFYHQGEIEDKKSAEGNFHVGVVANTTQEIDESGSDESESEESRSEKSESEESRSEKSDSDANKSEESLSDEESEHNQQEDQVPMEIFHLSEQENDDEHEELDESRHPSLEPEIDSSEVFF